VSGFIGLMILMFSLRLAAHLALAQHSGVLLKALAKMHWSVKQRDHPAAHQSVYARHPHVQQNNVRVASLGSWYNL
jgi:hypothetical protein